MIDNFGNQIYPGSVDNGATDTEHSPIMYPPKSTRIICASDEQHEALERRIAALETQVHRLLNSEPQPLGTERYAEYLDQGIYSSIGDHYVHVPDRLWHNIREELQELRQQPHPPEADYAHIPAAEWEAICAELEALRAKWESVPWEALRRMQQSAAGSYLSSDTPFMCVVSWYIVNHPKDATE